MNIPYVDLGGQHADIKDEILDEIGSLLSSGQFILGETVARFEEAVASFCQVKYVIGVANGTDALVLAMKAIGIQPGDEVITAPNSFLASGSSIILAGGRPVFVDVDEHMNMDAKQIEAKITSRTKAIMPVHLTGRPANMEAINSIAEKHGLKVIEDAAQAVGAKLNGKPVGGWGDLACFSLHPLKNLSACGDGGIITTNNEEYYQYLLKARNHGLINRDECAMIGYNSRLDALQAAILNVKMKYLQSYNDRRRAIASIYESRISDVVRTPGEQAHEHSVYHTYIIRTPQRDELQAYLKEKGVDSKVHYPIPIHLQEAFADLGLGAGDFPVCEQQAAEILSLPVYPELSDEKIEYICDCIQSFFS